ncbi:hypothetical protein LNU06_03885 [Campylobacter sp. VicNov18]|uniref:hypothetical protein n=1 Tax=Campylobacter bilis TaxID=2691918 RepID=UPI00187B3AF5|nr:hypothetical protein [Campylobacter bilis]MCC8277895.1 hypothetical protein [Campylobacter bilis]MCC8298826.1 hypothetical protein [Campylobacter bilis]MCC8300805.1 hypothetical protein [Campylobacter bilis]MCC8349933.1 hypothetical protein [Campylobacter bilis]MCC8355543.1 hypothetical protein [Campylobacter bilis]
MLAILNEKSLYIYRINPCYDNPIFNFCWHYLYYTHLYKNHENLNIIERLYKLQDRLYEKASLKTTLIQSSNLQPINLQEQIVKDGAFEFKKLYFQNQNYNVYFKE